ncbi:MAG: hypothetical protein PHR11_05340, partial [Candidatus Omnitrophica bacterium]|nr:hypothetical protein [Candidatus Omnitrophota bacterium]
MPAIINRRGILASWCVFVALAVIGNLAARFFCGAFLHMRCHLFWPLNVFWPRTPHFWHYARAALALAVFTYALRLVSLKDYPRGIVCAVSLALVLCTNFIAGGHTGFVIPIAGVSPGAPRGVQYFHEALRIKDLPAFVSGYQQLQPHLSMHARTHPPGPVILIYALHKLLGGPQMISIALAAFATLLSGFFLFGIAGRFFRQKRLAGLAVFLFFLIPAVQVYYCASVDAMIAALFLGVVYFFVKEGFFPGFAGAAILLIASSFMSFSFLFLLPVIAAFELLQDKRIFKAVSAVFTLVCFYAVFYLATGFNYLDSFLNAYTSFYARVSAWPLTAQYLITRL